MSGATVRSGKLRIEFHYDGFNELRRAVQSEVDTAGKAIAAAANSDPHRSKNGMPPFEYEQAPNGTRARGVVRAATYEGRRLQASHDTLSRALAQRGGA